MKQFTEYVARSAPLSEVGREQARLLGLRLKRLFHTGTLPTPGGVFTSDLSRAVETAQILRENTGLSVPILPDPNLRERFFGSWEGKTAAEVGHEPGSGDRAPDAEDYHAVGARMTTALEKIWSADSDDAVLIVGHGGSLRSLLARAAGLPAEGVKCFSLGNTSLSVVTLTGDTLEAASGRLLRVNDTAHLEK